MNKVLVFGGTHGNEWTGIYALKKFGDHFKKSYPALELDFILANPEAYHLNKRFKDEDLNRAFQFLSENRPHSYEHKRAKELKSMVDASPCFVLDLHTTTSNMGNTIIISHPEKLNFFVASKLAETLSNTRIIFSPDPNKKYLASQSPFGMMIEVGPVANGTLNAEVFSGTVNLMKAIFETLSNENAPSEGRLEVYEEIEDFYYPVNEEGEINAIIHKEFQGKDFIGVEGIYTPFTTFDGVDMALQTKEKLYPIFINEAAYYPSKLAYTLCRKRMLSF